MKAKFRSEAKLWQDRALAAENEKLQALLATLQESDVRANEKKGSQVRAELGKGTDSINISWRSSILSGVLYYSICAIKSENEAYSPQIVSSCQYL